MSLGTSCEKNTFILDENHIETTTITAGLEQQASTKTSLDTETNKVLWRTLDTIKIFTASSSDGVNFELSGAGGSITGNFIGKGTVEGAKYAIYPNSISTGTFADSDKKLSFILPAKQTYKADGFADGVNPMVAKEVNGKLEFKNLCGILKLQLTGTNELVTSITIESANHPLCGTGSVDMNYELEPIISLTGNKKVVLNCMDNGGVKLTNTPTSFHIVLPPTTTDDNSLKVIVTLANVASGITIPDQVGNKIMRTKILVMPFKSYTELTTKTNPYIEKGIYYGEGVAIEGKVWAPVNCGYEPADDAYKGYPYGKLYQWGRKVGQGYNDKDATIPTLAETYLSFKLNTKEAEDGMVYQMYKPNGQWLLGPSTATIRAFGSYNGKPANPETYNNLSESVWGSKIGNPCPIGWLVPTLDEYTLLLSLAKIEKTELEVKGLWLGENSAQATSEEPRGCVFMPYIGRRDIFASIWKPWDRGTKGLYWTDKTVGRSATVYIFTNTTSSSATLKIHGSYGIRCIKTN